MGKLALERNDRAPAASRWIAVALGIAVAMRLFALWLGSGVEPIGDARNYLDLAHAVAEGHGLALGGEPGPKLTAMFPPLLPLLLAMVSQVAPLTALTMTLFNSLVDVAAAALLVVLARQWGRPQLGIPLALAYLLWPSIALMAPLAYKEGLLIALVLATLTSFQKQATSPGIRWALLSGLLAGLCSLTQPAIAPFLALGFVAVMPLYGGRLRWLRCCAVAAAVCILTMLPWWIRNALVFDRFIPLTTSSGMALWVGAHPSGGMKWQMPPSHWFARDELQASAAASAEAWKIISADPPGYLTRCLTKLPRSFVQTNWAVDQLLFARGQRPIAGATLLRTAPAVAEIGVVALALLGTARMPGSIPTRMLAACLVHLTLFCIWFEFSERHRLFMVPFILIAALAVVVSPPGARVDGPADSSAG